MNHLWVGCPRCPCELVIIAFPFSSRGVATVGILARPCPTRPHLLSLFEGIPSTRPQHGIRTLDRHINKFYAASMGGASSVRRSGKQVPTQNSRAESSTTISLLLALPDAEFARVLGHLADRSSVLRLRLISKVMRARITRDGEACLHRLRWISEMTSACTISNEGRTLTRLGGGGFAWASASLLPKVGTSSWTIRVDQAAADWGGMHIGVCDASGLNAWGICLHSGKMSRRSRDGDGLGVPRKQAVNKFASRTTRPPAGWPDGHGTQVMRDERGRPASLCGRANGAVIEVLLSHDLGTLSFRINDHARFPRVAVSGFPRGAPMRPWARLYDATGDRVTLLRNWGGASPVEAQAAARGMYMESDEERRAAAEVEVRQRRSRDATRAAGGEVKVRAHMRALGVAAASADERAIRAAFRAEALRCHPDKNASGSAEACGEAEARFRVVNDAHASLLAWVQGGGELSRCGEG